ncbi:MAG TPA: branched-chain amino acid transaminase [Gemmatimonadaceae bacterium]|jgi:branched-chain amino acid aminotransferase|nr:branched-chain amino acid transaminase [Gemmatimonadaceae bacterium]
MINEAQTIWRDGEFVPWHEARVHVLSLAVQFGSSVFEGIRCYATPRGPAIFRLHDHLRRLLDSCRIYRMELSWSLDDLAAACVAAVEHNGLESCYIRPTVLRGYGASGMHPAGSPLQTFIAAWPWGTYLGDEALAQGVDVGVSSWQRMAPNTFPAMAKSAGNYNNAQLIKMEAVANGYAEGVAISPSGLVSEGSGQNLFLVRGGALVTPLLDGSNLTGITRDTVITLARELDIPVHEQPVPREALYTADELFFTGTASEVVPIRSVDRVTIGAGRVGPVTRRLQELYLRTVRGETDDPHGWLTCTRAS